MSCVTPVCSRQLGAPGIPPFYTEVSIILEEKLSQGDDAEEHLHFHTQQ